MSWPPQPPDPNPTELVWDELEKKIKAKQSTSASHVWTMLPECWNKITELYLMSLIERMSQICLKRPKK